MDGLVSTSCDDELAGLVSWVRHTIDTGDHFGVHAFVTLALSTVVVRVHGAV